MCTVWRAAVMHFSVAGPGGMPVIFVLFEEIREYSFAEKREVFGSLLHEFRVWTVMVSAQEIEVPHR